MLKIILFTIAILLAALLIYAATRPDTFRLQRSITINAPADKVFPFINDFHHWPSWSPWEKMDLNMKKTHSGPPQGKGAVYEWDGNNQVGTGGMEIVESMPPSRVLIKLDFLKPFEAHNFAEFTLQPQGNATSVTWAMYGPQPFLMRIMGVFCSPERMVGPQFEAGLVSLKTLSEK